MNYNEGAYAGVEGQAVICSYIDYYAGSNIRGKLETLQTEGTKLFSVWNSDSEKLTKEMNVLLRRTISYYDYKEDF